MPPPEQPAPPPDLRATGERIDALLDASSAGGAVARERAEELVRLVTDLYGAGLERLMDILYDAGHLDDDLLGRLADDELVAALLMVHGLHPHDVGTRVEQALERVRPYLGSHGGDVELLAVTGGVVRLRLLGSCDGCPSSAVTLTLAVESAIEAAAPEVTSIEVETAEPEAARPPLIPVDSLRSRLGDRSAVGEAAGGAGGDALGGSWHRVPELDELAPGAVRGVTVAGTRLVACRVGTDLFAFRDRCARCESSLAGAALARRLGGAVGDAVLRCPGCQAHYDVRRAGNCVDAPGLHLDPLPLLADASTVSVAVPTPVGA